MFKQICIILMYATLISGYEYSVTLNSIPAKIIINVHLNNENECPIEANEFMQSLPNEDTKINNEPYLKVQPRKVYSRKLRHIDII